MATIHSGWQELRKRSGPKCPKLFYSFSTGDTGYELQFTDLIGLWIAKADIGHVYEFAREQKTSIDPSISNSQLKKLFQTLAESLVEGSNSLHLSNEGDGEDLVLLTSIDLPTPFRPLQWTFFLGRKGSADLAENILKPCLHQASEGVRKLESLLEVISAKDRVISKLTEKLEASSMDFSLIFPGITGARARKGQVTIKEAQRHVPGLAEFRQQDWEAHFDTDSPYAAIEKSGLGKLVAGSEKCHKHTLEQHQMWLQKLPKTTATTSQVAKAEAMRSSSPIRDQSDSETQFETQKKRTVERHSSTEATDTASEGEPALPNRRQRPSSSDAKTKAIEVPYQDPSRSKSPESSSTNLASAPQRNEDEDSEATASSSDSDLDAPPRLNLKRHLGTLRDARSLSSEHDGQTESPSATSVPQRNKLGRLRGAKPTATKSQSSSPGPQPSTAHEEPALPQNTTPKHRLGKLGRKNVSQTPNSTSPPSPAHTRSTKASTSSNNAIDNPTSKPSDAETETETESLPSTTSPKAESPYSSPSKSKRRPPERANSPKSSHSPTPADDTPQDPILEPEPDPEPLLSKEEQMNKRREELKRKEAAAAAPAPAVRKKRKF